MQRIALASSLVVVGISGTALADGLLQTCENVPFDQANCVRALACLGTEGVHFDGMARGWDAGTLSGELSDGAACVGRWSSDGPLGTGIADLVCDDGTEADIVYYTQDNVTGTVIGRGMDNRGRAIRAWSGLNVLEFLTPDGQLGAELPCGDAPVPIS
ncbi:hypothetical protein [Jannaschia aquimarina]|uniref:Cyanovirin-N domain-containing protein n=1 Tax=Jannaschia aquimarina TaxID=935700 RepID=A0A0D1EAT6_9RHOB|nr:hypothetical protein [Jannaschia aquimarina]KIT14814.1 hypothetical protein jaqu_31390 [Jannaschia aquimarina]SNS56734.1 hypothetical protein SAMN05421775_101464 [Jannaschia aquimarina]